MKRRRASDQRKFHGLRLSLDLLLPLRDIPAVACVIRELEELERRQDRRGRDSSLRVYQICREAGVVDDGRIRRALGPFRLYAHELLGGAVSHI